MKLKYSIIKKLNILSRTEMDLFLYMVKRADQTTGVVEGVYYKDVMKQTGMCRQSVYNALRGLERKNIITLSKCNPDDVYHKACIIDNAFPTREEWKKGYVNLNRKVFHSKSFQALKAHEKYMLFEFLKGTHENGHSLQIGVEKLYKKFMDIFGVTWRVIREYLHSLKKFFSIGIKDGKYYITYRHSVFEEREDKSEEQFYLEHLVKKECVRNHISYNSKSLEETAALVRQYRQYCNGTDEMMQMLLLCIQASVDGLQHKLRTLQYKYIHTLVRKAIGLETA